MLTTTLDGLWVLQVLTGIEVLAPELGLRPHLPSVETWEMALANPVTGELRQAGVIDAEGAVDETVREWLTVLSRRDIALLMQVRTPAHIPCPAEPERIMLARFAHWWVCLERNGLRVRLSGAGTAATEHAAGALISSHIARLCGRMPPATLKPVTVDVAELLAAVGDTTSLRAFLVDRRFDSEQVAALTMAADTERSAQASIVAIQAGVPTGPARSHVHGGAVTIIDTPGGRLISEHLIRAGMAWMIVSPGSPENISAAVVAMMRSLPAHGEWFSHRKAV